MLRVPPSTKWLCSSSINNQLQDELQPYSQYEIDRAECDVGCWLFTHQ